VMLLWVGGCCWPRRPTYTCMSSTHPPNWPKKGRASIQQYICIEPLFWRSKFQPQAFMQIVYELLVAKITNLIDIFLNQKKIGQTK
jgi:hypothetical protein